MGSMPGPADTDAHRSPEVREALPNERRPISRCLARAFEDDPVSCFIFPDARSRPARLRGFYRQVVRMMAPQGAIYTDDALRGAAIWKAPNQRVPRLRAVLDGLGMLLSLREAIRRALALEAVVGPARPREPHWYLAILGTDPAHQGQGVGSKMVAPVLERCDATGMPAYLESSKEENIPFYQRHGFRVTGELEIQDGPVLWTMRREAQGSLNPENGPAE